jgi:hypothetical protein
MKFQGVLDRLNSLIEKSLPKGGGTKGMSFLNVF